MLVVGKPVALRRSSKGDGLIKWLLFSFALPALSEGSQAGFCGGAAAVLGEAVSAPRPIQALWACTPTLPVRMGALLGLFSLKREAEARGL